MTENDTLQNLQTENKELREIICMLYKTYTEQTQTPDVSVDNWFARENARFNFFSKLPK